MKYSIFFALFLISCSFESVSPIQHTEIMSDFYIFEAKNGFEVFYDSGTTKSIQEYYITGSIVFNGSYFGGTKSGEYYPAGYWAKNKQMGIIPELGRQFLPIYDDPNITHFVGLSGSEMKIFENSKFKENAGPYDLAFQAGPLVLSGNILQDFGTSWHARGSHERTLLGRTQSGKIYFFIFIKPTTLAEVGNKIQQDSRFVNDPIMLLNLDGGPSTAYFDGKNGFRSEKKLPIIFRIKL